MKKKSLLWGIVLAGIAVLIAAKVFFEIDNHQFRETLEQMNQQTLAATTRNVPVEHKQLEQQGYNIHYYTSGNTAGDLIIFLHPAIADHRCFDSQIDFFSQNFRVITVDLLGHGKSQADSTSDKIDASYRHLKQIMDEEGYEKAHLVGVSLGSLIAQHFAAQYPDKVSSLVAVGGYDIHADEQELKKAQRAQSKEIFNMISRALFSMNAFRKYIALNVVASPVQQARIYEMSGSYTRKSFRVMPGINKLFNPHKNYVNPYPLLILNGDKEPEPIAITLSESWNKRNGGNCFQLIKNAGHCANMDNPDDFNAMVMGFLENLDSVN